jgi:serine/threonine protein kinase
MIGEAISHYRILSKLGAGAAHPDRMKRFVQEAKSVPALNHPNILTIYEIEQIDSVNFIATEFIDGETLRERMRNAPMKLSGREGWRDANTSLTFPGLERPI